MKYYISDESKKSLKCKIKGMSLIINKLYKLLDKKGWCMMSLFIKKIIMKRINALVNVIEQ